MSNKVDDFNKNYINQDLDAGSIVFCRIINIIFIIIILTIYFYNTKFEGPIETTPTQQEQTTGVEAQ